MATAAVAKIDNQVPLHNDKTVRERKYNSDHWPMGNSRRRKRG
jgi:hypothetical protein